jgi:hypothetical protein
MVLFEADGIGITTDLLGLSILRVIQFTKLSFWKIASSLSFQDKRQMQRQILTSMKTTPPTSIFRGKPPKKIPPQLQNRGMTL